VLDSLASIEVQFAVLAVFPLRFGKSRCSSVGSGTNRGAA
jgi:hypothetical protein